MAEQMSVSVLQKSHHTRDVARDAAQMVRVYHGYRPDQKRRAQSNVERIRRFGNVGLF